MSSSRGCCASRDAEYLHVTAGEIPELAALLIDVSRPGESHSTYRCRGCGQLWHAYRIASAKGDDFAVVKVGDAPAAPRAAVDLPRAPAPPPPARKTRGPFGGFGALLASIVVFYAVWSLPGLKEARFGWIARWLVGAVLIVFALQSLAEWLASRKAIRRG
jgi:hypothetical protein